MCSNAIRLVAPAVVAALVLLVVVLVVVVVVVAVVAADVVDIVIENSFTFRTPNALAIECRPGVLWQRYQLLERHFAYQSRCSTAANATSVACLTS